MSPPGDRETSAADEFVRESFRDIKRALEGIQKTLSGLHHEYVSQRAYEHDTENAGIEFKAEQLRHDRDIRSVKDEIRDMKLEQRERDAKAEEHARQAKNMRIAVWGIALATLVALPGSLWALHLFLN